MAKKFYEELADILYSEVMMAEDYCDMRDVAGVLFALGNAKRFSTERSRFRNDLIKFNKSENNDFYSMEDIDEKIDYLMSRNVETKKVKNIRTEVLFETLVRKFIRELDFERELWDTALIIYSLGLLYDLDDKEQITKIIRNISNPTQKRLATVIARVYFKQPDDIFEVFSLEEI